MRNMLSFKEEKAKKKFLGEKRQIIAYHTIYVLLYYAKKIA